MRGHKLIFCAIGAFVTLFAAVTAIIIFKNEIAGIFSDLKEKFDDKKVLRRSEFSDYADM